LKEFFYELDRIRDEAVSQKEITDAKSYLTGVFPIRLETQEGLVDQLVQIKMLGLPDRYLHDYRDRVQAVTIEEIKRVAQKYIQPDKVAIIIVGDGTQIIDQINKFTDTVEIYDTSGRPKAAPGSSATNRSGDVFGEWSLEIETPMGQNIPASLTLTQSESGVLATIESEMGGAELSSIALDDDGFNAVVTFDMDGQAMNGEISGAFDGDLVEGTLRLQGFPSLTFSGRKT
jgi:hypothetical protein